MPKGLALMVLLERGRSAEMATNWAAVVVAVGADVIGDHEESAAVLDEGEDGGFFGGGEEDVGFVDDVDLVVGEIL